MSEPHQPPSQSQATDIGMFGSRPPERAALPVAVWASAAVILLAIASVLLIAGRKKPTVAPNTLLPLDAYSESLPLTQLAMSESSSLSGGKLTYLDGHIQNTGTRTITGVTVQVVFANDETLPPQIETLPVTLIRMREPYIDTEAIAAEPLKPGDDREFRLIFESIPANWNTQLPAVRVVQTTPR